ncbi:MAG: hypothetical protein ABIO46_08325 [Chitinophagales bacterium]
MAGAITTYYQTGTDDFVSQLHHQLLKQKIRFPLLEQAGAELYEAIPGNKLPGLTDCKFYLWREPLPINDFAEDVKAKQMYHSGGRSKS